MQVLQPEILTKENFFPYGDVIELSGSDPLTINSGNCLRYHDLAMVDVCSSGVAGISLFDAKACDNPLTLDYVERHPLGSQAFYPTNNDPFLVVVATDNNNKAEQPVAFVTNGFQGVNYRRNTWHGVLTPIVKRGLYVVVDYIGAGDNLQEYTFATPYSIDVSSCLI